MDSTQQVPAAAHSEADPLQQPKQHEPGAQDAAAASGDESPTPSASLAVPARGVQLLQAPKRNVSSSSLSSQSQSKPPKASNAAHFFLTAMVAAGGFALVNWLTKRGGATANNPKTTQPAGAPGKGKKAVKQKNASTKAKRVTDQRQEAAQGTSQAEEPAPEPVEPDTFELFCSAVTLAPSIPTDGPTPPQPLAGLRVAVSEDLGLAGAQTSYGTPEAVMQDASTSSTCGAVSRLVSAGAAIIGKTSMQPLGTDLLGTNYGNPYNKAKISGGGHTGEYTRAGSHPLALLLAGGTGPTGFRHGPCSMQRGTVVPLGEGGIGAFTTAAGGWLQVRPCRWRWAWPTWLFALTWPARRAWQPHAAGCTATAPAPAWAAAARRAAPAASRR